MPKKRKQVTIEVRLFSQRQLKLFQELAFEWCNNKPKVLNKKSGKFVDYELKFEYATNFKGFINEYKSINYPHKFKIFSIK